MNRRRSLISSVMLCGMLAVPLAGCSSTPDDNAGAACDAYAAFVQSVGDARTSLTSSSTVGEISAARDKVKTSYANLDAALGAVSEDRRAALADAWTAFDKAVSDIDENMTVPEAADSLQEEVGQIESAQTALNEDLVCS